MAVRLRTVVAELLPSVPSEASFGKSRDCQEP
jgi:hypothetical protein